MIIHPGFIKTGTTSLQEFLFFAHPQVHALGHPHGSSLDARISNALRRIEGYDSDPEELRSALAVALEAIPAGRVPVLSDETLTTDPRLTAITAQRLHHHFPHARIVFTIRRHAWLPGRTGPCRRPPRTSTIRAFRRCRAARRRSRRPSSHPWARPRRSAPAALREPACRSRGSEWRARPRGPSSGGRSPHVR